MYEGVREWGAGGARIDNKIFTMTTNQLTRLDYEAAQQQQQQQ